VNFSMREQMEKEKLVVEARSAPTKKEVLLYHK
jgi:hypothetical protein